VLLAAAGALIAKPSLLRTFLQHGSATGEIALRLGAWETGIRVILTHPLTGVGLAIHPISLARSHIALRCSIAHSHIPMTPSWSWARWRVSR